MLKNKTKEWAYGFIKNNLKAPSFEYERQNAYAAYQEVFGIEFASPEEVQAKTDKEEIERLKAELEAAKAQKSEIKVEAPIEPEIAPTPEGLCVYTKDEFKVAHPELKGIYIHHAWVKYCKENGIEK